MEKMSSTTDKQINELTNSLEAQNNTVIRVKADLATELEHKHKLQRRVESMMANSMIVKTESRKLKRKLAEVTARLDVEETKARSLEKTLKDTTHTLTAK